MIRLRQIAMIAPDLDPVVDQLREALGVEVCFHDPGVAEFGLRNALLLVGDQFLEVLSPIEDDTTVGRLLAKRGGAGGYMAIYEVDDLDARLAHLAARDVRIVWAVDLPDIRGRHLHPRDVGGAIVSLDEPVPAGSWRWGGPDWPSMTASRDPAVDSDLDGHRGVRGSRRDESSMGRSGHCRGGAIRGGWAARRRDRRCRPPRRRPVACR